MMGKKYKKNHAKDRSVITAKTCELKSLLTAFNRSYLNDRNTGIYDCGIINGLILAISVLENTEPEFITPSESRTYDIYSDIAKTTPNLVSISNSINY